MGYSPGGRKETDRTEWLRTAQHTSSVCVKRHADISPPHLTPWWVHVDCSIQLLTLQLTTLPKVLAV